MLVMAPVLKHKQKKPTCMLQYEVLDSVTEVTECTIKVFVVVVALCLFVF